LPGQAQRMLFALHSIGGDVSSVFWGRSLTLGQLPGHVKHENMFCSVQKSILRAKTHRFPGIRQGRRGVALGDETIKVHLDRVLHF